MEVFLAWFFLEYCYKLELVMLQAFLLRHFTLREGGDCYY